MITAKVSAVQFLLLAGIYVSSMSSCLGAMYGTPRVLQSIALENVIPGIGLLGKGVSLTNFVMRFESKAKFITSEVRIKFRCIQWLLWLQLQSPS